MVRPVVLMHADSMRQTRVPLALFVPRLLRRVHGRLVAFRGSDLAPEASRPLFLFVRFWLQVLASNGLHRFVARLGARQILQPSKTASDNLYDSFQVPATLRDLEDFRFGGIVVGDLIYDQYCKQFVCPSPDLGSPRFFEFFQQSLRLVVFWTQYFDENQVAAVVGHCVYRQGIPCRIAIERGIPVFVVGSDGVERLSEANPTEFGLHRYYPELAKALGEPFMASARESGGARLRSVLSGGLGGNGQLVYPGYAGPNPFGLSTSATRHLDHGDTEHVLIAAHDFFDSTHQWGKHFFPDYLEWLLWLAQASSEYPGRWYLKAHPQESPETLVILREIVEEFPHIKWIDPLVSPIQLVEEGLTHAVTVSGSIASEYPALGVTVINCSRSHLNYRYNYSFTPRNLEDLSRLLRQLPRMRFTARRERELHEWHYFRNILEFQPLLVPPKGKTSRWRNALHATIDRFLSGEFDFLKGDVLVRIVGKTRIVVERI